jgi:hypothetical protein
LFPFPKGSQSICTASGAHWWTATSSSCDPVVEIPTWNQILQTRSDLELFFSFSTPTDSSGPWDSSLALHTSREEFFCTRRVYAARGSWNLCQYTRNLALHSKQEICHATSLHEIFWYRTTLLHINQERDFIMLQLHEISSGTEEFLLYTPKRFGSSWKLWYLHGNSKKKSLYYVSQQIKGAPFTPWCHFSLVAWKFYS